MPIWIRTPVVPARAALAAATVAVALTAVPAAGYPRFGPFGQSHDDRVVRSGDKVRIGSGVTVEADDVVMGDVVSILGSARVDGQVTGDVVVVLGDLTLGPEARVNNVTVVGGELRRRAGARVRGDLNEIGIGRLGRRFGGWGAWDGWGGRNRPWFRVGRGGRIGWTLFRLLFLAAIVMAVVFVAPATVRRVGEQAAGSPWMAVLIGMGIQIFFLPVLIVTAILLAISIIGIPLLLLLPFVVLAVIVAAAVGFSGVAYTIGGWVKARGGPVTGSMFLMAFMGVFAILALALVGRGVALGGGLFGLFGAILLACAFLVEYAAWTVGLGATVLAGFSGRRYMAPPPSPPSPPPPPSTGAAPIASPPGPPPAPPPALSPPGPSITPAAPTAADSPSESVSEPAGEFRIVDPEPSPSDGADRSPGDPDRTD